jgi:tRNA modification GTPase
MAHDLDETIAAIASAPGGAARGVIRVSGPDALACLTRAFEIAGPTPLAHLRQAAVVPARVHLPGFASPLDCDLYVWPGRRSYTRQPAAEIHTLGSPPLLASILALLAASGARPARPGEFTLRAFLAGRLDLTQAEAVLGVIDAADGRSLQTALAQLAGGLATPLHALRGELLDLLAHLEAGLDFVEEDIQFISPAELDRQLVSAAQTVDRLAARLTDRAEAADRLRIVLVGWPNVGKSSLFNALAGHDAALVSNIAGTTRDYVTARMNLAGLECELIDTAGIEPDAALESIARDAQQSAGEQHVQADVQLLCLDAARPLNEWERSQLSRQSPSQRLVVWTKVDAALSEPGVADGIRTSSVTGTGLASLRDRLREVAAGARLQDGQVVAATAVRCRESLRSAAEALARARDIVQVQAGEELVAAEVRGALHALGEVVGAVYTDDILDRIFSRFCIGK